MTARQGQPPLSRRQLREKSGAAPDDVQDGMTDTATPESTGDPASAPVRSAGGRRVRWDPTGASAVDASPADASRADDPVPESAADVVDDGSSADRHADATAPAFTQRDQRPEGRRSFAPAFVAGESSDSLDSAASEGELEPAASDGETSSSTASAPDDIDLAAPERPMTRRELRILRARAEAAGLPAPDVMFLPNGESTVTGAIPILDGVEFTGQTDATPEADAAGVVTEVPTAGHVGELPDGRVVEDDAADAQENAVDGALEPESGEIETAVEAEVVDADASADHDRPDASADDAEQTPAIIPALIEPDPTGPVRFPAAATSAEPEHPAEIIVEAQPATGDHPVSHPENPTSAGDDSPAPGRLRPFDAMFLPPSARDDGREVAADSGTGARADGGADDGRGADARVATGTDGRGADSRVATGAGREGAPPDTSSSALDNDTDGLRGEILAAPVGATKPFGHWSTHDDEDEAGGDSTLSRDVGTGVLTTHALVLPSVPAAGEPLLSPLTSTGEVMVTGIVELPKSYGSTGAHPTLFDHPEVDSLIDDADREDTETGVAPVRATRAVSSTTTTRSMVENTSNKRSRWLPIAIAVGGVVVVAAAIWAIAVFVINGL